MDDDLDDLLGTPAPRLDDFDDDLPEIEGDDDLGGPESRASGGSRLKQSLTEKGAGLALKGAPPGWFAAILGIGRTTVQRKIGHLPARVVGNGTRLYDVREALPFLVQPHDLKKHLMQMNPRDLPERLRKEFWGARKLEQQVRREAGELWHHADISKAFGDVLKLIKDTAILWTDTVHEAKGLTPEQVDLLDDLVRDLLQQVGDKIDQYASGDVTLSHESEYDDEEIL